MTMATEFFTKISENETNFMKYMCENVIMTPIILHDACTVF